ncbi:MAG TPA: hypothetical protein PK777_05005 [Thermoguttaceae bacterium]|mgnify:CR=1 FL=1|nr:hypothetical protein [Thermoguttaceae bacterium]
MSNVDEVRLGREVVSAAQAAVGGQPDLAQDHLRSALAALVEARQYYYPAENYLLDVTVLAVSTLGPALEAALQAALEKSRLTNLLLGAAELEHLARQAPEMLELLRRAWSEKKVGVLAGGKDESPLPHLPLEAVLENIQQGLGAFERLLGQRPRVFGRRRYGLSAVLPQILAGLGLEGALHGALDEGRFPTSHQSKIRWEGVDGTTVDGLGRVPLDAARADSFLRIVRSLGDTLDWDHTSMAMLAHWPGQHCPWLDDLHRIGRFSAAVGRFVTVEDYLEQTRYAGQQKKYSPDEYRSPYLRQETARQTPDPISRWVYYHRVRTRWEQLRTLRFLVESLTGLPAEQQRLAELQEAIRTVAAQEGPFRPEHWAESLPHRQGLEERLESACRETLARLAEVLYPGASAVQFRENRISIPEDTKGGLPTSSALAEQSSSEVDSAGAVDSLLIVNPASFTRRMWFSTEGGAELASLDAVRLAGRQQGRLHAACETAGMGFVRVDLNGVGESSISSWPPESLPQMLSDALPNVSDGTSTSDQESPPPPSSTDELIYPPPKQASWAARLVGQKPRPLPPLAEEHLVRNEFFEARLDPTTGALRGVYNYNSRRPRCAQQLALRIPPKGGKQADPQDSERNYTIMAADAFRVISAGPVIGQLEVQGRLMTPEGQLAARFREIFRCRRGEPLLEILIHLEPELLPEADPWNSYYACRFAWGDQTAELFRSVNQLTCRSEADRLETPWFVDLRTDKERTTLLFGGLPYHRRIGVHKLDTLLVVRGETARWFRVGIGVELKHPMCAAWDFLAPAMAIPLRRIAGQEAKTRSEARQGWFFHLNVRNVLVAAWESIIEEERVRGFRVRLVETEGRATTAQLRSLRPPASASQVDFTGKHIRDLAVEGDAIQIPIHAYQYLQVEARYG